MESNQIKNLLEATEEAGITTYAFIDDMSNRLYNSDHAIVKVDYDNSQIINFRNSKYAGSHNVFDANIQVTADNFADVHMFTFAGNYDQIKTFSEKLGLTLTNDDVKILLDIDKMNYDIIPPNGDYNNFKFLSKKQYEALTPAEKEAYDAAKAAEEKRQHDYIGQNIAASISV